METLDTIKKRSSVRNYIKKELSKNIVEDIINCGRMAPSAKNRQPWFFVIVKETVKDKIADMMLKDKKNSDPELRLKLGSESSVNPTAHIIKQAPVLVLIFKEKNENLIETDNLSIGACVENMCLRATDLNIGSLFIRDIVYVAEDVADMLGHSDMELNCALSLGYTAQFPKPRLKKNLKDIIEWYNG